ncbi:MAG: cation:proton antiporter, partial [Bacillota bacterium]
MEIPLLKGVLIIFSLSVVVLFLFHKIKIPAVVGYLLTGILAGPHGLKMVNEIHEVEMLAEIGIVLLLFTIGLEFSFDRLFKIKKPVILGGSLQVALTSFAALAIAQGFGLPLGRAVFIGFLISLSSTAIVLKLIQQRAEIDSPYGRASLGILIFQDIIIVPMIIFTPLLAGTGGSVSGSLLALVTKGVGIIVFVIISAKWVVPHLLFQIARTRNRELFLLSIVVMGLAVAWLTSSIGLSLALGAFLAGLIISESEYSHQALGSILPFRDVFTSFFFVSVGMLLDVGYVIQNPGLVALAALGVLVLKALVAGAAVVLIGFPLRAAVLVGLALSQVGEFSFILSETGLQYGLLAGGSYQLFLAVSILTMAVTPFVIAAAPGAADLVLRLPLPARLKSGWDPVQETKETDIRDHLIIIGYGINGKNVARAAYAADIPYVIIEMNAETVREEREKGEPIIFGDAAQEAVLKHVNVKEARVVVVAISDPAATRRIIEAARRFNPKVYIIVRTR